MAVMKINTNIKVGNEGKITPYLDGNGNPKEDGKAWILLEEKKEYIKRVGAIRTSLVTEKRTALLDGNVPALQAMIARINSNKGAPGKIVVLEMTESELPSNYAGDDNMARREKYLKVAGDTEIPCTIDGENIYRFSLYVEDADAQDILIQHNNSDEIRAAQAVLVAEGSAAPEMGA